jgi:hypothetical protein
MIIVLSESKFTEFSYINYELDIFEKKLKEKIEIHDLSKIINPKWRSFWKTKNHKKAKVFDTINQWENYLKKINKKNERIIVFNELWGTTIMSLIVQFKLSKYVKKIVVFKSPGRPIRPARGKNIFFIYKKIIRIILNPSQLIHKEIIFFLKIKILKILSKLIIFNEIYIMRSGKINNFIINLGAKKKKIIDYHFRDYDRLISLKREKINYKNPIAVFLDTPDPYFKDDFKLFKKIIKYNKIEWYKDLNNYLLNFEKINFCKVVIIPHSKVKGIKNPYYNKNFEVCHDLDAVHKLIPVSKFVITINASTAINLAVACKKPVIFIYNEQQEKLNESLLEDVRFVAQKCNSSLININNYSSTKETETINKKFYENYLYNYVTSRNISKKKNYEIINNLLEINK